MNQRKIIFSGNSFLLVSRLNNSSGGYPDQTQSNTNEIIPLIKRKKVSFLN